MNQPAYSRRRSNNSAIPDVILLLLLSNALVFALQKIAPNILWPYFALWSADAIRPEFMPWQLLTYGWMHGNLTHIAFNMFGLWMFGTDLERQWGPRRFITFFVVCVIGSGMVQYLVSVIQGGAYPTVGASGGLYGVLLAYGLTFPNRIIVPLFPPIPMRAIVAVGVFAAIELFSGISGVRPGVASFAHLGGMIFGFLMLSFWSRPRRR